MAGSSARNVLQLSLCIVVISIVNVRGKQYESSCVSSTQPSAMERSGFKKDCKCCRESSYKERTITLNSCYDQDGHKLEGSLSSMQVTLREPDGCQCFSCGSELPK